MSGSLGERPPAAQSRHTVFFAPDGVYQSDGEQWVLRLAVATQPTWGDVSGKPATFPPESHTHGYSSLSGLPDLSTLPTPGQKNALEGTFGTPGTAQRFVTNGDPRLSDARAPTGHTHPVGDVSGLQAALDGKAASSHSHAQADITGLAAALAAKQDAATAATDAELTAGLAGKQDTSQKGQANGYASLDGTGKVPAAQLPAGQSGFAWEAVVRQAADVTTPATAAFVNTDLVFTFAANGVYVCDLFLLASSAAATTGYRLGFDTSVAVTTVAATFSHVLANTGTVSGGQSVADDTATGLSSGVPTANAITPIQGSGWLVAAATGGTARLRFGPEVAAAATFKANSVMRVHRVA
jgi:hypothetical protein